MFFGGFTADWFLNLLYSLPAILIALSFHEFAHAWTANKMGDPTAKNMGRLTLDPIKHLDLFGTICLILFRFGWAKPVPALR
jgi:Zn-dependent protease